MCGAQGSPKQGCKIEHGQEPTGAERWARTGFLEEGRERACWPEAAGSVGGEQGGEWVPAQNGWRERLRLLCGQVGSPGGLI